MMLNIKQVTQWYPKNKIEGVEYVNGAYFLRRVKLCPGDIIINGKTVFRINHGVVNG